MKCPHCGGDVALVPQSPAPLRVGEDPRIAELRRILEEKAKEQQKGLIDPWFRWQRSRIGEIGDM